MLKDQIELQYRGYINNSRENSRIELKTFLIMHFFIGTVLYITIAPFPGQAENPADQTIVEAYQLMRFFPIRLIKCWRYRAEK